MSVRLKCDMDRLNFSRYLVKCWTSYVKAPVACWMLDLLCDMLGSCWMLDISCDVRISLDVGRPTRRQVLVGCWISRVMSAPIGRESHAMSHRFLLDVGCLAQRQVLVGCWVPHMKAGSCWILSPSSSVRFLFDLGYLACCARFLLDNLGSHMQWYVFVESQTTNCHVHSGIQYCVSKLVIIEVAQSVL